MAFRPSASTGAFVVTLYRDLGGGRSMPELPEVETMRRGIAGALGSRISGIHWFRRRLRPIVVRPDRAAFAQAVVGRTIASVDRAGKRIVLDLDEGSCIIIEPRMTGLLLLSEPPNWSHLRLRIRLRGGAVKQIDFWDQRGLGQIAWVPPDERAAYLGVDRIGPDALSLDADQLGSIFQRTRQPIKVALLNQRLLAGIGNLYAAEILHRARISPFSPASGLSRRQLCRLASGIGEILETAIRCEGSTLGDGTYRNALNQDGTYQGLHRVYMKAGERCPQCGRGRIRRVVQAQRSTFYCPVCQRA